MVLFSHLGYEQLSVDDGNDPVLGTDCVSMVKGQKDQYVGSARKRIVEVKQ